MDGPAMAGGGAGGTEIGSAYVSIGGDLSGLRAAEQEAKEIASRIASMGSGGTIGGGGSIGNPVFGASMPAAGGGIAMSIKIDEASIRQQLDLAIRNYAPQAIKIPVEIVPSGGMAGDPSLANMMNTVRGLAGNPPSPISNFPSAGNPPSVEPYGINRGARDTYDLAPAGSHGRGRSINDSFMPFGGMEDEVAEEDDASRYGIPGSRRNSGFNWKRLNLLTPRGLARGLGVSLTGLIAADYAIQTAGAFAEASNIREHPEYITQQYATVGAGATRQLLGPYAAQLAARRGTEDLYGTIGGLPFVGSLFSAADSIIGEGRSGRAAKTALAEQSLQSRLALSQQAEAAGPAISRLQGLNVAAETEAAANQRAQAYKVYEASAIQTPIHWYDRMPGSGGHPRVIPQSAGEDYMRIATEADERVAAAQRTASSATASSINAGRLGFATAGGYRYRSIVFTRLCAAIT
jgi:hypothetical protein